MEHPVVGESPDSDTIGLGALVATPDSIIPGSIVELARTERNRLSN